MQTILHSAHCGKLLRKTYLVQPNIGVYTSYKLVTHQNSLLMTAMEGIPYPYSWIPRYVLTTKKFGDKRQNQFNMVITKDS
jgi:hypothetical protein